jgi:NAD(P)-dependent dehydrogenase (short-subunit alcohol dehydrogenase family)
MRNAGWVMRDRGAALTFLVLSHRITRFGRPEEIGGLVDYLASSKANFIIGSIIDRDSTRSLQIEGSGQDALYSGWR